MADQRSKKEKSLQDDLQEFNNEREKIKQIVGGLGGSVSTKKNWIINSLMITITLGFFIAEFFFEFIPRLLSLEIGILFVSVKIIMLIFSINKQNHFEFWILNSIEYRLNLMNEKVDNIEKRLEDSAKNGNAVKTAGNGGKSESADSSAKSEKN